MKVLWFVSSLEQKGGGERFALEAIKALKAQGHDVCLACDRLSILASFDGFYDISSIVCFDQKYSADSNYLIRVLRKTLGLFALLKLIFKFAPDLVVCQSEFDAIKLYILSKFKKFRYRVFVFGQMYQFKTDITRYSSVFIKNLKRIVESRPGYRSTVLLPPPKLPPLILAINEIISRFKFKSINQSDKVFTLSKQVQWEVGLNYSVTAFVCRAAFDESYIDYDRIASPKPLGNPLKIISVCRLVDKKRVDIIINGFLLSRIPAVLSIIGSGPEEDRLKLQVTESGRSQDICFLGAVNDITLQNELASADCFISMDVGDYDIAVVEAMGKGLRVIVANDFDVTGFNSDFTGIKQVDADPVCIAYAIQNIHQMPAVGPKNLETLLQFTWQSLAKNVVS